MNKKKLLDWLTGEPGLRVQHSAIAGRDLVIAPHIMPEPRQIRQVDGAILWTLTERVQDRHGSIIEPGGVILKNYLRNPVLLWSHDYFMPAIGTCTLQPGPYSDRIQGWAAFASTQFAQDIRTLYAEGVLRANSVGIDVLEWRPFNDAEREEWASSGYVITRWELWEDSACNVPSNPAALVSAALERCVESGRIRAPHILHLLDRPDLAERLQRDLTRATVSGPSPDFSGLRQPEPADEPEPEPADDDIPSEWPAMLDHALDLAIEAGATREEVLQVVDAKFPPDSEPAEEPAPPAEEGSARQRPEAPAIAADAVRDALPRVLAQTIRNIVRVQIDCARGRITPDTLSQYRRRT